MNTKGKVPATETGATRGDGIGTRQFTTMPKALGHNVTTNAGRHATGEAQARVGTIRQGQGPSGSGVGTGANQKTGVPAGAPIRSMAPRPSIPANQADTSNDLEKRLMANPQPFTYQDGAATLAAGSVRFAEVGIGYEYKSEPGAPLSKRGYGVAPMGKDAMEAAASVDGMPSSAGVNPVNSGYPTRGNQRQAGMPGTRNTNTSRRDNSRMRQG